jgi:hypothetical protein
MSTAFRFRVTDSKARALGSNAARVPGGRVKPHTDYAVRAMRQEGIHLPKRDISAQILAPLMPDFRPFFTEASIPVSGKGHSPPNFLRNSMPP